MNDFRCMCVMWSRITPFVLNFEYQKSTVDDEARRGPDEPRSTRYNTVA